MSRVLTSSKLIDSIRKRGMLPTDTATYTDDDILSVINEEIDVGLLTTLLSVHENHLLFRENFSLSGDRYAIPYRAIGNKLREVSIVNTDGSVSELSQIGIGDLSDYRTGNLRYGSGGLFYVEGNEVVILINSDNAGGSSLRMHYYLRPSTLVAEKQTGIITSINRTTGVITLSSFPDNFATIPMMDFVGHRSPNKIYSIDKAPISVDMNTKTVTFNVNDIPKELIVGDYVCKYEESPVPNVPTEMHPLLAQRSIVHILEALGDTEGLANAKSKMMQMETSITSLIDNRIEDSPQKIRGRNNPMQDATRFRSRGII
jgi:hypothetical protein